MYVTIAILVVFALYLISFYNGLKTAEVRIRSSIQEIGNQLKRQANLIPNLVDSVKGYLKHEKDIFKDLTDARKIIDSAKSTDAKSLDKAQESINRVLGSLNVVVESNPEIKASGLVADLMAELRDTADKIMYARRTVIDLSADYNVKISTIPGVWFAAMMGFSPQTGLDMPTNSNAMTLSSTETQNPKANL